MRACSLIGIVVLPLAILAAGGCRVGPTGRGLEPARSPHGVTVAIPHGLRGELLEAREDGMVLLVPRGRIVLLPYQALEGPLRLARGVVTVRPGSPPRDENLRRLQALSRFPRGIPAPYLQRLLGEAGQAEIEVLD
jgi:hypothetical protein